ncbi:MAG: ABC transporter permease [Candidatus Nomurabacteria bacterium]|jgi:hypothetical protein|nr:ABC transporter permease [Candidatus Nomurabacteria bacterium]
MTKFFDTVKLAATKFHAMKIRTALSVAIPSILFAVVLSVVTLTHGVQNTLSDFNDDGLGGRFLVSAYNNIYNQTIDAYNEKYIELVEKSQKELVEKNTQTAKDLGLFYDKSFDPSPVFTEYGMKRVQGAMTNVTEEARQTLSESYRANAEDIFRVSAKYHPTNVFVRNYKVANGGNLFVIEDGVENFEKLKPREGNDDTVSAFLYLGLEITDDNLAQSFITTKQKTFPDSIPLIVTYPDAEKILGLKSLPDSATPTEKINRILTLRNQLTDRKFQVCYRNKTSAELINSAFFKNEDAVILYEMPESPCAPVTVESDKRTDEQKTFEERRIAFKKAIGEYEDAWQQEIAFTIIGFTPETESRMKSNSIFELAKDLTGSSLSSKSVAPRGLLETFEDKDLLEKIFPLKTDVVWKWFSGQDEDFVVEFANREDAMRFVNEKSCVKTETGCATEDKPFELDFYGNNSVVIDELSSMMMRIIVIGLAIAIAFLVLLMVSIFTKIISSNRKEIAVFRAIGFTRLGIIAIYQTYAVMLALAIAILATGISMTVSWILSNIYSGVLTSELRALFSSLDYAKSVVLFQPNPLDFVTFFVLIVILAIFCCSVPAFFAIQRNPIKDLRED